jgi:predicted phosphodiesterase
MKVAIAGDFHSNKYATQAFAAQLVDSDAELLIVGGDLFGYYPWAAETYTITDRLPIRKVVICGNHDRMVLELMRNPGLRMDASYWPSIEQNLRELQAQAPESLEWLQASSVRHSLRSAEISYDICHGTPADPLNGRFYPDDREERDWFPRAGEAVVMGHTHYPIARRLAGGGFVLNPGSVGQPRDGNPDPSWMLFDEASGEIDVRRFKYDIDAAVEELEGLNWDQRAIRALRKDQPGRLA